MEHPKDPLEVSIRELNRENKALKEELAGLREHLGTRIEIEEARPPLSCGKPCPKCGQIYKGG
jgi:hypothetical protein